ncbi:hypothetical protein AQI95_33170 [Streptomyces yokosukanensis]|uniref:Uncharacterized protein n=1 Tax=Streptomyces yokosukanensis TaxID=67386 RepID=A0A117PZP9_9ACTN|nr:hypothetical protein [Streptomyces yokosukanensis]KUN00839.1 hypothetical protein AQI95_33170 [Streptomyces yokosukanensis]
MHAYDTPPRRSSFSPITTPIPSARTGHEGAGVASPTPIYDMLYTEWVKAFRTLPGDRSGEEGLRFSPFGQLPDRTGSYGGHRAGSFSSSYSAYSAGAYNARQQSQWQRVGTLGRHHEDTGMHHVPAALPPGPRRGV